MASTEEDDLLIGTKGGTPNFGVETHEPSGHNRSKTPVITTKFLDMLQRESVGIETLRTYKNEVSN